ncbi:hypothetical protein ACS0TY_013088 [Phlomoides rotata]
MDVRSRFCICLFDFMAYVACVGSNRHSVVIINNIAMARICRRKYEVMLVVEEIIFEIVFMLMVVLSRYRNNGHFWGLNVGRLRR